MYSKIHRDDKKEGKKKRAPNNGAMRAKDEENQGTAVDKNITIGTECDGADKREIKKETEKDRYMDERIMGGWMNGWMNE